MTDAMVMANYVAENVKEKDKLKKNVLSVKAAEESISNCFYTNK